MQFRNYKLIEIANEGRVEEHVSFTHQYLSQNSQKFEISDDFSLIIEKLQNLRVFVYEVIKPDDFMPESTIQLKRRFVDYPHDFSNLSQFNYLFSPNLRKFLTYDRKSENFIIRSTFPNDDPQVITLPLLSKSNDSNIHETAKRFKWVSNNSYIIASEWGFEKLYEIEDG